MKKLKNLLPSRQPRNVKNSSFPSPKLASSFWQLHSTRLSPMCSPNFGTFLSIFGTFKDCLLCALPWPLFERLFYLPVWKGLKAPEWFPFVPRRWGPSGQLIATQRAAAAVHILASVASSRAPMAWMGWLAWHWFG